MERRLRGLVLSLAIIYYIVCIHHNMQTIQFYNEARMRLENNVLMHCKRRARIASHFKRRRALILLNSDMLIFRKYYQRSIRRIWTCPRSDSWWPHINATWTDDDWLKNFRMRRGSFRLLCDILRPWLTRQNTKYRQAVPVEARVAICVWRLATNLEYRSISQLFGVGLSTCCTITQEVVTAINVVMKPLYIKHPSAAEFRQIIQGFRDKWRFPQVAGAIDGTHIKIRAPPDNSSCYYNQKGDYSIILQGVVDHRMRFWDINVGRPGKIHVARGVDVPLFLLGDLAYPLLTWLMKPYPEGGAVTPQQLNFNHRLRRWHCLLKENEAHITFVTASCLLAVCCIISVRYRRRNFWREKDEQGHAQQQHNIRNTLYSYFATI
uniref:DDE Tnp4 domain-containing protein n=1 Tax=Sinocyclocheilus rhinocerous TaxID=307959 RepID=A0A673JIK9_9TELE